LRSTAIFTFFASRSGVLIVMDFSLNKQLFNLINLTFLYKISYAFSFYIFAKRHYLCSLEPKGSAEKGSN
jgi:hypothetical protein